MGITFVLNINRGKRCWMRAFQRQICSFEIVHILNNGVDLAAVLTLSRFLRFWLLFHAVCRTVSVTSAAYLICSWCARTLKLLCCEEANMLTQEKVRCFRCPEFCVCLRPPWSYIGLIGNSFCCIVTWTRTFYLLSACVCVLERETLCVQCVGFMADMCGWQCEQVERACMVLCKLSCRDCPRLLVWFCMWK